MRTRFGSGSLAAAVALILSLNTSVASAQSKAQFELPEQPLAEAIRAVARQASVNILVDPRLVEDRQAPAIKSQATIGEALSMLLEGTGLTPKFVDDKTITLVEKMRAGADDPAVENMSQAIGKQDRMRLTQAENSDDRWKGASDVALDTVATGALHDAVGSSAAEHEARRVEVQEVIVTGSHIRGAQDYSAPVITFTREDIEAGGYSTTQQLVQSLPQNFSNVSDTTGANFNGGPIHGYGGSGLNLRGLGSQSTLVLLNNRRLSAAGKGDFIDVSLIPLSAIERVEVLTDGASAIYGSDAVGGVVNFVLRKDFSGAETRIRHGSVTEGNHSEQQAGQLFGHAWRTGHALMSYEYFRRTPLAGEDRSYMRDTVEAIPRLQRQSAYAMLSQKVSERIEINADVFFGDRVNRWSADVGVPFVADVDARQFGGSLGMSLDLGRGWQIRASGVLDANDSTEDFYYTSLERRGASNANKSRLGSLELAADGPVARAPGGEVRLAVGAQYRDEDFSEKERSIAAELDRQLSAGYLELRVPWVGIQNRVPGVERLEMTLAGRAESYSDFGSTVNPRIGLAWVPLESINLRGTWGTSFRAPLLTQINPADAMAYVYTSDFRDPEGGTTPVVMLTGSGMNLQPEESTNWTIGIDLKPSTIPMLDMSVTYFDVNYDKRIRDPFPVGYDQFGVLSDPVFSAFVRRYPDPAQVAALLDVRTVLCTTARCPAPEEITAIVDRRVTNITSVRMSGLDLAASYALESSIGTWGIGLSGQYLLRNREIAVPGASATEVLNNVWSPVDLRVRGNVSFTRGAFNASTFVNFSDGYRDTRSSAYGGPLQRPTVSSWTTVDMTMQFDLGKRFARMALPETTLSVSAFNLFDRDPPFVGSSIEIYFDGANAHPRGRFVSAQLTVRW